MYVLKIIVICIVFAITYIYLKNVKSEYAIVFELSCILFLFFLVLSNSNTFFEYIENIISISNNDISFIKILFKALLISVVTDFASTFCRDCQSETLSKGVDLIGKTAILSLSLPLVKEFIEIIIGMI